MTPWWRGEAGHARGLSHAKQRDVLTLSWVKGVLDSGYSPDAPLFSSPEVAYITLRWAFRRLLRHHIRNKGEGGGGLAARNAGMSMEGPAGKSPIPRLRTNRGSGFDAGQNFYGPTGSLAAGLPMGAMLAPLGGKGLGIAAALRAQVGVHPPAGIHF